MGNPDFKADDPASNVTVTQKGLLFTIVAAVFVVFVRGLLFNLEVK